MASSKIPRHIIVTGVPGIGKTTLIRKICEELQKSGINIQGFYTEEIRNEKAQRIGFDVVTTDGQRGPLARTMKQGDQGGRNSHRVGHYEVKLQDFEHIALMSLRKKGNVSPVYIIDEIGKMELFSSSFKQTVDQLMTKPNNTVLATIPAQKLHAKSIPFVDGIRSNSDVVVFEISRENRDLILDDILQAVVTSHKHYS